MLSSTIDRETFPPDILRNVEFANATVLGRMKTLEPYDIRVNWRCGHLDGTPYDVTLDLVAVHKGRSYSVKEVYPASLFAGRQHDVPDFWNQLWAFSGELSRMNRDELKEMQARSAQYDLVGAS